MRREDTACKNRYSFEDEPSAFSLERNPLAAIAAKVAAHKWESAAL